MKEIVSLNKDSIKLTADFILIARKPAVEMTYKEVEGCIIHILKKAGLYKDFRLNRAKRAAISDSNK